LGARVAALWHSQGDHVYATTRKPSRIDEIRRLGAEPVVCDILDPASLRSLPAVAAVVHCVGLDRAAGVTMRTVYVDGLANLLAALPAEHKFVHVGSTSVYGQTGGEEVDETAATEPDEESGRVVLEAERLLRGRRQNAIILRFAGIYGPGRWLRAQSIRNGEPIVAAPERWLNLIHVEDGAAAVAAAMERARPGAIYNVSDGSPVRRREFYVRLAAMLGAPPPRFVSPPPGKPLPPHERADRRIISQRIRDDLGWSPRFSSYLEGLRVT
jgi:nucleoside-diphosphate-sugar epimerase